MLPGAGFGPCQAVTLNITTYTCFFKDGNITTQNLIAAPGRLTAIASASQFTTDLDFQCPSDLQKANNGMVFEVNCNHRRAGDPFAADVDPYYQPHHSDTLQECIEWCSEGSPLCYGVVWEADTLRGYRNCWPRSDNISSGQISTNLNMHVAQAMLSIDLSPCNSDPYITANDQTFHKTCDTKMDGPFIGQVHTDTFDACIDYCASLVNDTAKCTVALYQPTAADGFENCYLKTVSASAYSDSSYHVAVLNQLEYPSGSEPTSTPATTSNPHPSSGNKSWIAGAIIGPLAAIGLIAGLILWWNRRKRRQQSTHIHDLSPPHDTHDTRPLAEKSTERDNDRSELDATRDEQSRRGRSVQELP